MNHHVIAVCYDGSNSVGQAAKSKLFALTFLLLILNQ